MHDIRPKKGELKQQCQITHIGFVLIFENTNTTK